MVFLFYLLLGCIASLLSGLLGIGGGLVLVPGLVFIFSYFHVIPTAHLMHMSIGTSLASSIVNLLIATHAHHLKKAVKWGVFKAMWPGVLIGTLLIGPYIILMLDEKLLKIIFGVFCLLIFLQFIFHHPHLTDEDKLPDKKIMAFFGLCIGTLSTLLGIAGGAMVGALLHHYRVDVRKIVGTSSSVSIVIAISATIGLLIASHTQVNLPPHSTGYIYWPAFIAIVLPSLIITPLGAKLAHRLPTHLLKKIFGGLMLVIGIKMLLS